MKPASRDIDNRDVAHSPIPHIDLAHLNLKTCNKIQNKCVKFQREYLKTVSIRNIVHDYWCTYGADKIRVAEVVAQRAFAEMFGLGRKF